MKKTICFLTVVVMLLLTACSVPSSLQKTEPTQEQTTDAGQTEVYKPVVTVVEEAQCVYACDICGGNCSYFTGAFRCAAIDRTSADAQEINAEIAANYEKYLLLSESVGTSGLAYGFDFSVDYEDENYLILRTAIETVLLHNGGAYSYDFYYYDPANDCKADVADVCAYFGLDINVLAAYLRIELSDESAGYEAEQIQSITADCIDIFPSADDGSYYVRVQNDQVKYETKITSADLNSRADEIASQIASAETDEPATDENGAQIADLPTSEQDVIYMEY